MKNRLKIEKLFIFATAITILTGFGGFTAELSASDYVLRRSKQGGDVNIEVKDDSVILQSSLGDDWYDDLTLLKEFEWIEGWQTSPLGGYVSGNIFAGDTGNWHAYNNYAINEEVVHVISNKQLKMVTLITQYYVLAGTNITMVSSYTAPNYKITPTTHFSLDGFGDAALNPSNVAGKIRSLANIRVHIEVKTYTGYPFYLSYLFQHSPDYFALLNPDTFPNSWWKYLSVGDLRFIDRNLYNDFSTIWDGTHNPQKFTDYYDGTIDDRGSYVSNIRFVLGADSKDYSRTWAVWDNIRLEESQPPATLEILDGVDFTAGKEISSNPEKLASSGTTVTTATADGVTRLLLRLNVEKSDKVTFSLQDTDNGVLRSIDGSGEGSTITVNTVNTSEGEKAFAIYQAPGNFVRLGHPEDEDVSERAITLNVQSGYSSSFELSEEIKLVRPPVILVHGLWSGPEMWDENDFRDTLANELSGIRIFTPNYKKTNAGYFSVNKAVLKKKIEEVKEELRSQQIAMIQADVIGHSMGGLLARIYAGGDNWYYKGYYANDKNFLMGDINKLITLDSPHFGSFLADIGMEYINDLHPIDRERILEEFRKRERPLDEGAVEDMITTSPEIEKINRIEITASSHAIIGDYPVTPIEFWFLPGVLGWTHRLLTWAGYDTRPYVVERNSDLVVSRESQAGGLTPPTSNDFRHHHMNATTPDALNGVVYLLNADPEMWLFNPGFPVKK